MKLLLSQNKPIIASIAIPANFQNLINVSNGFFNANQSNFNLVDPTNNNKSNYGYHAICIVGYNEFGFVFVNSWGEDFGKDGYCTISYKDCKKLLNTAYIINISKSSNNVEENTKFEFEISYSIKQNNSTVAQVFRI